MILKNENILQTSRVKLKKCPLFDEVTYRKSFCEIVLSQKPLFLADSFLSSSAADSIQSSSAADPKTILAKRIAQQLELRVSQSKEIKANKKENHKLNKEQAEEREEVKGEHKPDTAASNVSKSDPVGQIHQFYKVVNNQRLEAVHELFEIKKSAINEQLFKLVLEIYCLFQLSKQETSEEFRVFFEIDTGLCLEILFGEDVPKRSIFEAVIFKKTEYEGRKEKLIQQMVKKSPLVKKMKADKLEELFQICFIEWKSISEDFGSYENNIKRRILELNDPRTIADNIVYDIEENLLESCESHMKKSQEQEINGLGTVWNSHHAKYKEDLRWEKIISFRRELFNSYSSVSAINDYEKYLESFIVEAQNVFSEHSGKWLVDLIQASCTAAKKKRLRNNENDQNYKIKDLLSEKYINGKLWHIIKNNSNRTFYNLLSQKAPVMVNSLNLKIIFVEKTLESGDAKIPQRFLSETGPQVTYLCSLIDKLNIMRVSDRKTPPSLIFCGDLKFRDKTLQQFKIFKLTLSEELKNFISVISKVCYTISFEKTETRLLVFLHEAATGGNAKIAAKFQNVILNKDLKDTTQLEETTVRLSIFELNASILLNLKKKDEK